MRASAHGAGGGRGVPGRRDATRLGPPWVLILAAALWLGACLAQPAPPPGVTDLPADEIRAGMTGYGLTQAPEGLVRFEVEVMGRRAPGVDALPPFLVRTSGQALAAAGVAAGMSGSPIYLGPEGDERLAGALAYAFPGSDHRLALATPIEAMRDLAADRGDDVPAPPGPDAAPLATPLLLTGIGPRGVTHLAEPFRDVGLSPLPVQGGALREGDPRLADWRLAPGAAVAATLIRGDMTVAAIGTVTDVRDGTILAFGHPLLGRGGSDLALAPAHVLAWIAQRDVPYKLAEPGAEVIGRVIRDGRAGMVGRAGEVPSGLPITVRVNTPRTSRAFAVRVADDGWLAPSLLATVVEAALDLTRDRVAGGGAELAWEIDVGEGAPVRVLEQVMDETDLARSAARLAAGPLAVLLDNPFRDPRIERLSLTIEVQDRRSDAEIVEVALEEPEVAPGGTVTAFVRLQPFRGEAEVRTLRVGVPDDVQPGPLTLTFRGASVPDPERPRSEPEVDRDRQATSGLPPVLSWAELIGALETRPQARELLAEIPGPSRPHRLARDDVGHLVRGLERVRVHVLDEASTQPPSAPPSEEGDEAP